MHPAPECFLQKLTLTRARERVGIKAFIRATGYPSEPFDQGMANARANGWRTHEVACGHDVMLDMPERLAELLKGLSRQHSRTSAALLETARDALQPGESLRSHTKTSLCLPSGADVSFFREEMPEKNFCIEMEGPIQDIEHIGVHIGPFAARR